MKMSNLQTLAGGIAWSFTALLLMFAALEPVSVTTASAPQAQIAAASAAIAHA